MLPNQSAMSSIMDSSGNNQDWHPGGSVLSIDASRSILNPKALLALKVAFAQRCKWTPLGASIPLGPMVPLISPAMQAANAAQPVRQGKKRNREGMGVQSFPAVQPELKSDDKVYGVPQFCVPELDIGNNDFSLFDQLCLPELPKSDEFDHEFDPLGFTYAQQTATAEPDIEDTEKVATEIAKRLVEWREGFAIVEK